MFAASPEEARARGKAVSLLPQLAQLLSRYQRNASFAVPCLGILSELMIDDESAVWVAAVDCGLGRLAPAVAEVHRQDPAVHVARRPTRLCLLSLTTHGFSACDHRHARFPTPTDNT